MSPDWGYARRELGPRVSAPATHDSLLAESYRMQLLQLKTDDIVDWKSFHNRFADLFGFPDFYGANMDAWIDCMSSLDDPDAGLSTFHLETDERLVLEVLETEQFQQRCPEQFESLVTCTAFVNQRFIDNSSGCRIALAFV